MSAEGAEGVASAAVPGNVRALRVVGGLGVLGLLPVVQTVSGGAVRGRYAGGAVMSEGMFTMKRLEEIDDKIIVCQRCDGG